MSTKRFPDVETGYPFPKLELEVLDEWQRGGIFAKSLEKTKDGKPFVFFEGPPTANNKPHVGHVVTRVIKDLFPRFQTMRGRHVVRKAGWDTHGLPVEIEVEKKLGFSGKQDIEEYGVEKFNQVCLESVHAYERQWREMSERIGFWIDLDSAYYTYSNQYIESVWWALSSLWKADLLVKDYKIQPYCSRCGTTLSSHEVAQNYKDTDDPSVWVLFPAHPGQTITALDGEEWTVPSGLSLVAWTTTPWTLLGHSGIAVSPKLAYKVVRHPERPEELLLFAEGLEKPVPLDVEVDSKQTRLDLRELPAEARFEGSDLQGLRYDRPFLTGPPDREPADGPFDPPPSDEAGWRVFAADYVTDAEGTGLVHTAPAFGEDDYQSGVRFGLPFFLTVDAEGKVDSRQGTEPFAGVGVKEADSQIIRDLKRRGRLLHGDRYRHSYPFCWRCDEPLLYYASRSWFVRTTDRKSDLLALNQEIDWHPEHVKDGRFGNWLENIVDWALSRKRYWGTPLPVWECGDCGHTQVVGSYEELFENGGMEAPADRYDRRQFDPHRPFIDEVHWPCSGCGDGTMNRVEEVIDAWFDSGSMPFAQYHYPFDNPELIDQRIQFPADFIAEAVDQTRGWFYTLHVLATLLFDSVAYKTCIVLGHVNDEQGRKMSKRLGNVVDPMEVIPETGADALRWYFCVNNPEINSRFSVRLVKEAAQSFLLPIWNSLSFFTIYANLDGWRPGGEPLEFDSRPALDRWILLRLDRVVTETTRLLEGYRVTEAARGIEEFVDDLTNWYIRRSRDRFWAPAGEATNDKESAYQALYTVLTTTARLIAPLTPFVAEVLHGNLVRSHEPEAALSVHLEDWPQPPGDRADQLLEEGMAAVQRIVRLGHAARNAHALKTRQPLPAVTIVTTNAGLKELVEPKIELLRDELNVREVKWADERSAYVHHEVRPVFPVCGPRFGKQMPALKRALEEADGDALASQLEAAGSISIELDGQEVELASDEVEVRLVEREGTATQGDRELLVALDTTLDDDLIAEGWAREVIHRLQSARKEADLDYADRIRVRYRADTELETAIDTHRRWIAGETLATELAAADSDSGELETHPVEGMNFAFSLEKAN
ncbi:MAG: isoleucine--tRNA ligase [Thermoanaerobaculia bacterium]